MFVNCEVTELALDRIQWQALFNGNYNLLQVRYRKKIDQ